MATLRFGHPRVVAAIAGLALTVLAILPALAITTAPMPRSGPYVAAFQPLNSNGYPYTGTMHLQFSNGRITGTYSDTSIRPGGPFSNRLLVGVSGNYSGNNMTLIIGSATIVGTFTSRAINGSTTTRGRIWQFSAAYGRPGSGR